MYFQSYFVFAFFCLLCVHHTTVAHEEMHGDPKSSDTDDTSINKQPYSTSDESGKEFLKHKPEDSLRKKKLEEAKLIREEAVRKTLKASASEECDWKINPLRSLRGEVCGSYYKILGLNRKDALVDKSNIKKSFRQLSLVIHPDKNPSENAQTAFKALLEAYECLSDDLCKENYDHDLAYAEEKIQWQRHELKNAVIDRIAQSLEKGYIKLSQGANQIVYWGSQVWDLAGELKVNVFEEEWPVGRPLLVLLLAWKGILAMQLYGLAFLIVRINHEIAKGNRMM